MSSLNKDFNPQQNVYNTVRTYASCFTDTLLSSMRNTISPLEEFQKKKGSKTDCFANTIALAALFHPQEIQNLMRPLSFSNKMTFTVTKGKKAIPFFIENLLIHSAICTYTPKLLNQTDCQYDDNSCLKSNVDGILDKFARHISTLKLTPVDIPTAIEKYSKEPFDFNRLSLEKLASSIDVNKDDLSLTQSYIYYLAFMKNQTYAITHSWVIEQFIDSNSKPRYRLYDSLTNEETLEERLAKSNSEGMDHTTFVLFLKNLEAIICPNSKKSLFGRKNTIPLNKAWQHCFKTDKALSIQQKTQSSVSEVSILGDSFIFQYAPCNTTKIKENLDTFFGKISSILFNQPKLHNPLTIEISLEPSHTFRIKQDPIYATFLYDTFTTNNKVNSMIFPEVQKIALRCDSLRVLLKEKKSETLVPLKETKARNLLEFFQKGRLHKDDCCYQFVKRINGQYNIVDSNFFKIGWNETPYKNKSSVEAEDVIVLKDSSGNRTHAAECLIPKKDVYIGFSGVGGVFISCSMKQMKQVYKPDSVTVLRRK